MKKILLIHFLVLTLSSCIDLGKDKVRLIPVSIADQFEYIDRKGNRQINPQFMITSIHYDGLALVKSKGDNTKFGYISENGKFIIAPKYLEASVFSEEIAWVVQKNSYPTAINTNGKKIFDAKFAECVRNYKNGFAAFQQIDAKGRLKWGFLSKSGQIVISAKYNNVGHFNKEKCPVQNENGKWGMINKSGNLEINYQFDYAGSFDSKGHAIVKLGDKYGAIDESGKYIINPQYSFMKTDGDLFLIVQDKKYGWCDEDGNVEITPQFEDAYTFRGSKLAPVKMLNKWGYINKQGKFEINPQFSDALPFDEDLALVASSGKIGFINTDGKFEINPQFEKISHDYVNYISTGKSAYNSVNTDFFNVDQIVKEINFETPEDFNFNSNFNDVLKKYDLTENDLNNYSNINLIFNNKKISNDASLSFYIGGKAFEEIDINREDDWYSYTEKQVVFNKFNKINFFKFDIELSVYGKGYDKANLLMEAFKNNLVGYTKNTLKSNYNSIYYDNGNKIVLIQKESYSTISVSIYKFSDSFDYNYIDEAGDSYNSYPYENTESNYEPEYYDADYNDL